MLAKKISDTIESVVPAMIKHRRHLHRIPELSFQEYKTSAYIREQLERLGIVYTEAESGLGLIAHIDSPGVDRKTIAFRADFDALPVQEETGLAFQSLHSGVMHACGHDSHTAILLGLAESLVALRDELPGHVKLIFQHAEETPPGGAVDILKSLDPEKIDAIYGLHVTNELAVNEVGLCSGPYMAASDVFRLRISGSSGHGAMPGETEDTVSAAAATISQLNHIISRGLPYTHGAVVSVCSVHGGETYNVIPKSVELSGTIRSFNEASHDYIVQRIEQINAGMATAFGTTQEFEELRGYPTLVNDPDKTRLVEAALAKHTNIQTRYIEPTPIGEDFAYYLQVIPGSFFRLGICSDDATAFPLHHHKFTIDERALQVGLESFWSIYLEENQEHLKEAIACLSS